MSKTIKITIDKKTQTLTTEANGFVGAACKDATAALLAHVGTVTGEVDKPELHEQVAEVTQSLGLQGG